MRKMRDQKGIKKKVCLKDEDAPPLGGGPFMLSHTFFFVPFWSLIFLIFLKFLNFLKLLILQNPRKQKSYDFKLV